MSVHNSMQRRRHHHCLDINVFGRSAVSLLIGVPLCVPQSQIIASSALVRLFFTSSASVCGFVVDKLGVADAGGCDDNCD